MCASTPTRSASITQVQYLCRTDVFETSTAEQLGQQQRTNNPSTRERGRAEEGREGRVQNEHGPSKRAFHERPGLLAPLSSMTASSRVLFNNNCSRTLPRCSFLPFQHKLVYTYIYNTCAELLVKPTGHNNHTRPSSPPRGAVRQTVLHVLRTQSVGGLPSCSPHLPAYEVLLHVVVARVRDRLSFPERDGKLPGETRRHRRQRRETAREDMSYSSSRGARKKTVPRVRPAWFRASVQQTTSVLHNNSNKCNATPCDCLRGK